MTNFEYITQSPEKLAKHLLDDLKIAYYLYNQYTVEAFNISEIKENYRKKKREILNWLNQPYKE